MLLMATVVVVALLLLLLQLQPLVFELRQCVMTDWVTNWFITG
jgi:hypothetical protein